MRGGGGGIWACTPLHLQAYLVESLATLLITRHLSEERSKYIVVLARPKSATIEKMTYFIRKFRRKTRKYSSYSKIWFKKTLQPTRPCGIYNFSRHMSGQTSKTPTMKFSLRKCAQAGPAWPSKVAKAQHGTTVETFVFSPLSSPAPPWRRPRSRLILPWTRHKKKQTNRVVEGSVIR